MTRFNPTDIVCLSCGGPPMVVSEVFVNSEDQQEMIKLLWMDRDGHMQLAVIPAPVCTLVKRGKETRTN